VALNLTDLELCSIVDNQLPLTEFDCGMNDLNEFLREISMNYERELISKTFVFHDNSKIHAYFSLSNDNLTDKGNRSVWNKLSRKVDNAKRRKEYPAVKIGRLGVMNSTQSAGLGTEVLITIIGIVLFINRSACRFLIVDAYNNERTINFYKKNGFQFLVGDDDKHDETRIMFLDLRPFYDANSKED